MFSEILISSYGGRNVTKKSVEGIACVSMKYSQLKTINLIILKIKRKN